MAEFVQQSIEEMLPELEQMKRVGLFDASETRAILRKRKGHEYKLRRRTKQKTDYLQYIQYEMHVLQLVRRRRESTGYKFKRVEIDVAIVQRIHKLFKLACTRFQEDSTLWLSHIDFCKKKNEKTSISRLYTRMLQVHNRKPDLWIAAAKWEIEDNLSMENGRSLLQRGLRFNPTNQHLWQEYFRMELLNAEKLRKRSAILSGDKGCISDPILCGDVASIVYDKACEALPETPELSISLLKIAQEFTFTSKICQHIYDDISVRHSGSAMTWDALARRHLITPVTQLNLTKKEAVLSQEAACWGVFQQAVSKMSSVQMWHLYFTACKERLLLKASPALRETRHQQCVNVCRQAAENECTSPDLYLQWVSVLESVGDVGGLLPLCAEACTRHPDSAALWERYLCAAAVISKADVPAILNTATRTLTTPDCVGVWEFGVNWLTLNQPGQVQAFLEEGLMSANRDVVSKIKVLYLEWAATDHKQCRDIYTRLSTSQPLSLHFFQMFIDIENNQPEPKMKHLQQAYEDALREYGSSSPDLWLTYIQLALTHPKGRPENVGSLHWRAMKELQGAAVEDFVTKYALLQSGK